MTWKKQDFVEKIADEMGLSNSAVKMVIEKFLDGICDALARGDRVEFRNFGIFKVVNRNPRIGRNIRTGETIKIPARKTVQFKPGKVMKERVEK